MVEFGLVFTCTQFQFTFSRFISFTYQFIDTKIYGNYIWFFVSKYMFLAKWICLYLGGSTDCLLFQVNRGACLAIIPSACSHKLQPLHRGIIHKFKVSTDTVLFRYLYIPKKLYFCKKFVKTHKINCLLFIRNLWNVCTWKA